jgi:hypothetical protein
MRKTRTALVPFSVLLPMVVAQDFHEFRPTGLVPAMAIDWRAVAAGDLDRDGDLDQVFANFGTPGTGQRNLWLRNDGTGLFTRMPDGALRLAPSLSRAVVLGDFDRDGDLDAFFGNQRLDAICRNDGNGELALAPGDLPALDRDSYAAAAGDLDGDGDLDLVVTCGGYDIVYAYDGTGTFTDGSARLPAAWDLTVALDLGDYDGDGDLDLLRVNQDAGSQLLWNDGNGAFTAAAIALPSGTWITAGDLDGDGDRDFVFGDYTAPGMTAPFHGATAYFNQGSGTFTSVWLGAPRFPWAFPGRLADVDGDGDLDLALAGLGLRRNDGAGNFAPVSEAAWLGRDFADVDGDGDLDLIGVPTLRNDGAGNFPPPAHLPAIRQEDQQQTVALVDFDRDGDLDLARLTQAGIDVLRNDGRGAFRDATPPTPVASWGHAPWPAADWTGDGFVDLLSVFDGVLYENLAGTGFAQRPLPDALVRAVALDADGDGDLDLVGQRSNATAWWYRNAGNGTFAAGVPLLLGTIGTLLGTGDVDGDGREDLLWTTAAGVPAVRRCSGNGVFAALANAFPAGLQPVAAGLPRDLDGDGDVDCALGHDYGFAPGDRVTLLANDGSGRFTVAGSTANHTVLDRVTGLVAADVDEDGDLDLFAHGSPFDFRPTRLLRNDGAFQFANASGTGDPWSGLPAHDSGHPLVGDIDGDGDSDLLVSQSSRTTVLQNLRRQLVAREDPHVGAVWRLDVLQRPLGTSAGGVLVGITDLAPAQVTPFGLLRVDLQFASGFGFVPIAVAGPVEVATLPIPNLPALRGLPLFAQNVAFDGSTVRLGNQLRGVLR